MSNNIEPKVLKMKDLLEAINEGDTTYLSGCIKYKRINFSNILTLVANAIEKNKPESLTCILGVYDKINRQNEVISMEASIGIIIHTQNQNLINGMLKNQHLAQYIRDTIHRHQDLIGICIQNKYINTLDAILDENMDHNIWSKVIINIFSCNDLNIIATSLNSKKINLYFLKNDTPEMRTNILVSMIKTNKIAAPNLALSWYLLKAILMQNTDFLIAYNLLEVISIKNIKQISREFLIKVHEAFEINKCQNEIRGLKIIKHWINNKDLQLCLDITNAFQEAFIKTAVAEGDFIIHEDDPNYKNLKFENFQDIQNQIFKEEEEIGSCNISNSSSASSHMATATTNAHYQRPNYTSNYNGSSASYTPTHIPFQYTPSHTDTENTQNNKRQRLHIQTSSEQLHTPLILSMHNTTINNYNASEQHLQSNKYKSR